MKCDSKIVSVGGYDFRYRHLIVIGVLALAFTISFLIRYQPAEHGFQLNEFDPFFNYRATLYMVENGIPAYYDWHDTLSWHPQGRNISATSQVILHLTTAVTYQIFGGGSSLYDYTIIFPVVVSALTAITVFAMVRTIGGTTAGMIAALLYSVSLPILLRSPLGWFKSEPLGLFFGTLTVYLFLSGICSHNRKAMAIRMAGSGIITVFGFSAWGGNQFFIIPIAAFMLALPFIRQDSRTIAWAIPLYTAVVLLASQIFERSIPVGSLAALALVIPSAFVIACAVIRERSPRHGTRNCAILLVAILMASGGMLAVNEQAEIVKLPSFRYLNAINPFLTTTDPLVDSISEHATTSTVHSFLFHGVWMIFAGIGIWIIFRNYGKNIPGFPRNDMAVFALMLGITSAYVGSAFVRLEVVVSVGIIVLASIGISVTTREFFAARGPPQAKKTGSKKKKEPDVPKPYRSLLWIPYSAGIIALLVFSTAYAGGGSDVFVSTSAPASILSGGTSLAPANDWLDTFEWMRTNTPEDAIIASWWDYGYWISTMGERTSLADNNTNNSTRIKEIASILLSEPDDAWQRLQNLEADYLLVFVAGQRSASPNAESIYTLGYGGDHSKKFWFVRIAGEDPSKYIYPDNLSSTPHFWQRTLLGQMFPYQLVGYTGASGSPQLDSAWSPGATGIYVKDVKYPADGDGPLRLAYASPSFHGEDTRSVLSVLVYEINDGYRPGG